MTTIASPREQRVLLHGSRWSTDAALVSDIAGRGVRLTYDRGSLEIMSPSVEHEWVKRLIGRMVETLTLELAIPVRSGGSTPLKEELAERGLEPDECYYVDNELVVRGREDLTLESDPPPDLAVEVEISRSALDRMGIYATLGVSEVWRCDGTHLRIERLRSDGAYEPCTHSVCFPDLAATEVDRFLANRHGTDETTWARSFRDWVRGTMC